MRDYRARWQAVSAIEQQELLAATIQMRWQKLNAVIGLAIGLGILKTDSSEEQVYQRWAKLKNVKVNPHLKS